MAKLTLLVRAYCHLCDDMREALRPLAQAHGASVEVIDVDAPENAALETEWGERVPALFTGAVAAGTLLCHYHLDVERVARALDESRQLSSTGRVPGQNPL
jgi:hypothetical protein